LRRLVQERSTMNALEQDIHRSAGEVYSTSRSGFSCAGSLGTICAGASPRSEAHLQYLPKPPMDQSTRWGVSRYATLFVVLMLHATLLAWLMSAMRTEVVGASSSEPVQLLFLSRASVPKIRFDEVRRQRPIGGVPLWVAPPRLAMSPPTATSPPVSGSDGSGFRVDWAAEARRALQAFDIRSRQSPSNNSVSRASPAEQSWWPPHRAGERVKMSNGDWIVWVNSDCYRVATSAPPKSDTATPADTVCPKEPAAGKKLTGGQ
jgi:hypothetical protein